MGSSENRDKGLSRREFFKKSIGVAGSLLALTAPLAIFTTGQKTPAINAQTTHTKNARAWCMVISRFLAENDACRC